MNLLTEADAAKLLHVTGLYLRRLRVTGGGPKFFQAKKAGRVLYDADDLAAWVESKKRLSTTDKPTEDRAPIAAS